MNENVRSIAIPSESVNDFLRLLRERTEPWEQRWSWSWYWFLPTSQIRCEIDYPKIRLRGRGNRGQYVYLDARIEESESSALIRWSTELPLQFKLVAGLMALWISIAWIAVIVSVIRGTTSIESIGVLMVATVFFSAIIGGIGMEGKSEVAKLGDFVNSLAAEAIRAKVPMSQRIPS